MCANIKQKAKVIPGTWNSDWRCLGQDNEIFMDLMCQFWPLVNISFVFSIYNFIGTNRIMTCDIMILQNNTTFKVVSRDIVCTLRCVSKYIVFHSSEYLRKSSFSVPYGFLDIRKTYFQMRIWTILLNTKNREQRHLLVFYIVGNPKPQLWRVKTPVYLKATIKIYKASYTYFK